jgi:hypothetical protein
VIIDDPDDGGRAGCRNMTFNSTLKRLIAQKDFTGTTELLVTAELYSPVISTDTDLTILFEIFTCATFITYHSIICFIIIIMLSGT